MVVWVLLVVLLLFAVGAAPTWGWSHGAGLGWYPTGGAGLILLIVLILILMGRV